MSKLIILDRDGVINVDSDDYIKSIKEWIPIPGSIEAVARLTHEGWKVAVATNQSGLARGYFSLEDLDKMHNKMRRLVTQAGGKIDNVCYCPHLPAENCDCRKPKPGLYRKISKQLGIGLKGIPVVGDTIRDIEAARAVGAIPILVLTGKGSSTFEKGEGLNGVPIFDNLSSVVETLCNEKLFMEGCG